MRTDRQTSGKTRMAKLIVAFRYSANEPKKLKSCIMLTHLICVFRNVLGKTTFFDSSLQWRRRNCRLQVVNLSKYTTYYWTLVTRIYFYIPLHTSN